MHYPPAKQSLAIMIIIIITPFRKNWQNPAVSFALSGSNIKPFYRPDYYAFGKSNI
jgi:hypothetical protein